MGLTGTVAGFTTFCFSGELESCVRSACGAERVPWALTGGASWWGLGGAQACAAVQQGGPVAPCHAAGR